MRRTLTLHFIVGARPNFVKAAPVIQALQSDGHTRVRLIHTGQHFDKNLSAVFFDQLNLPDPDYNLEVHSASHAQQTAQIMAAYEPIWLADTPSCVIVIGDVNSTLATTLVAKKCGGKVAHLEAGLRSGDHTMPEEINRLAVDAISDLLLAPSQGAVDNLLGEGHSKNKIALVGNVMIDSLMAHRGNVKPVDVLGPLGITPKNYILATLHRPFNVDDPEKLVAIIQTLVKSSVGRTIVMPLHPRTQAVLEQVDLKTSIKLLPPLGYEAFLCLQEYAAAIVTDSGGIQEEASVLGVPCLTLRPNTERPITLKLGTNKLVSCKELPVQLNKALVGDWPEGSPIPLWDGKTAKRVVRALDLFLK